MLIGKFLWYLVIGYITIFVTIIIHIVRAELKGYEALKWFEEYSSENEIISGPNDAMDVLIGFTIWPIRELQFIFITIPKLYEAYELK